MGRKPDLEKRRRDQERFLEAFGRLGLVQPAAKESGVTFTNHYRWLREDADYAARYAEVKAKVDALGIGEATLAEHLAARPHQPAGGQRAIHIAALKERFLADFAEHGLILRTTHRTGISAMSHYRWMRLDPEYAARFSALQEATAETARRLLSESRSKAGKAAWADAEARAEWAANQRASWTPERRAEQAERMRERLADPEIRAQRSARQAKRWEDPDFRAKMATAREERLADPEFRARFKERMNDPDLKAKHSTAMKRWHASRTPEERAANTRPMRRAFKGGHKLTRLEAAVMEQLNDLEVPYLAHKVIGDYSADVYVPSLNLDIEADGTRFHDEATAEREATRDAALAATGITVLRLTEDEIAAGDWSRLNAALGGAR